MEAGHELLPVSRPTWERSGPLYGFLTFGDLFTDRQLVALTTFSDLVGEARERIRADAVTAGMPDDGVPLRDGGIGATAYAEAVGCIWRLLSSTGRGSKLTLYSLERWQGPHDISRIGHTFSRQASHDSGTTPRPTLSESGRPGWPKVNLGSKGIATLPAQLGEHLGTAFNAS